MKATRALVQGAFGDGNFGDDALTVVVYHLLREAYAAREISFLCPTPSYVDALAPQTRSFGRCTERTRAELLVYGGGTQFFSFSPPRTKAASSELPLKWFSRLGGAIRSPSRVMARLRGGIRSRPPWSCARQSAAIGIGLGPFATASCEEVTKLRLSQMDFIAVRDSLSADYCRRWGIANVVEGTDLCFLPGQSRLSSAVFPPGEVPHLGVVVRDWPHSCEGASYDLPLLEAVRRLRAKGWRITFVMFRKRDVLWGDRLRGSGERPLVWDPLRLALDQFCQQLSEFNCLVTARYHGAVFGALLGIPTICIEVEPKLRLAADLLGDGGALWPQPFSSSDFVLLAEQGFTSRRQRAVALAQVVAREARRAGDMRRAFLSFLDRSVGFRGLSSRQS